MATLRDVVREYWSHRPMELAAALSYYTLLSLAPLVLIAVAVAGVIFERATVEKRIAAETRDLIGSSGGEVVHAILHKARDEDSELFSVSIGAVVLLVGATTVFVQLQDSLNRIWKVEPQPHASVVWSFMKERLLSLAMVLAVGFLLLVSLLVSAGLSATADSALGTLGDGTLALYLAHSLVSLGVITLLFALIFKLLPDAPVAWRDVWFGAAITSVLFGLGKHFIGLYLGRAGIGSAYGAAGSLVVVIVWVYYASMIVLFGATLTYVRSRGPQLTE